MPQVKRKRFIGFDDCLFLHRPARAAELSATLPNTRGITPCPDACSSLFCGLPCLFPQPLAMPEGFPATSGAIQALAVQAPAIHAPAGQAPPRPYTSAQQSLAIHLVCVVQNHPPYVHQLAVPKGAPQQKMHSSVRLDTHAEGKVMS